MWNSKSAGIFIDPTVIMGIGQVPYALRDMQRIDLCAGWHIDTLWGAIMRSARDS
jgi:hypothetical protein